MTTCSNISSRIRYCCGLPLAIAALFLVLLPATIFGQLPGDVKVTIEDQMSVELGSVIEVPITLENSSADISLGGFELLIEYDETLLSFLSATEGSLLTDCGWEYFTYRLDSNLIKLVSIAETNNGPHHPDCFLEQDTGSIAIISFLVTSNPDMDCMDGPIQFYWTDCGDNAFCTSGGDTLFLSHYVYDWHWHEPIHEDDEFPTYKGAPDICLGDSATGTPPQRLVDFTSGRVDIICSDSLDNRGDLNLNCIAYEIADWVVYANYFLYGLNAFTVNVEEQIAASDVNNDGVVLTVRDLVYLYRVIIGDAYPYPSKSGPLADTAVFIQDVETHTVTLQYPDSLAAASLIFLGEIVPESYVGEMSLAYAIDSGLTRILIYSTTFEKTSFGAGLLFTYTGEGTLETVDVADYTDALIPTMITQTGETGICGDMDGSGIVDVSDVIHLLLYIFGLEDELHDGRGGDVNCDGFATITDCVYLLIYIFFNGPEPCAECP